MLPLTCKLLDQSMGLGIIPCIQTCNFINSASLPFACPFQGKTYCSCVPPTLIASVPDDLVNETTTY